MLNAYIFASEMKPGLHSAIPAPVSTPILPGLFHSLIYAFFWNPSSIRTPLFVNSLGVNYLTGGSFAIFNSVAKKFHEVLKKKGLHGLPFLQSENS